MKLAKVRLSDVERRIAQAMREAADEREDLEAKAAAQNSWAAADFYATQKQLLREMAQVILDGAFSE